jgi:hypothetical protein
MVIVAVIAALAGIIGEFVGILPHFLPWGGKTEVVHTEIISPSRVEKELSAVNIGT